LHISENKSGKNKQQLVTQVIKTIRFEPTSILLPGFGKFSSDSTLQGLALEPEIDAWVTQLDHERKNPARMRFCNISFGICPKCALLKRSDC